MEKIGAANLNGSTTRLSSPKSELAEVKVKLVRCLSSLQVETPRDELEAERLRLKKRVESAQSAGDMASGTDDWV